MYNGQSLHFGTILFPISRDDDTELVASRQTIDTLGYDYATVILSVGANTGAFTALQVVTDENTPVDAGTWEVAADFDPAAAPLLDVAGAATAFPDATNDRVYVVEVDLRHRRRYLSIHGHPGGTTIMHCAVILTRAEIKPTETAAARGVTATIRV